MRTINIKGTYYVPVNERIKEFRKIHKECSIETEIRDHEYKKFVIMTAKIKDKEGKILSTGHAMEEYQDNYRNVNHTSYIENCETSAVGRALGLLGLGIDGGIASYEEVKNAVEKTAIENTQEKIKILNNIKKELLESNLIKDEIKTVLTSKKNEYTKEKKNLNKKMFKVSDKKDILSKGINELSTLLESIKREEKKTIKDINEVVEEFERK